MALPLTNRESGFQAGEWEGQIGNTEPNQQKEKQAPQMPEVFVCARLPFGVCLINP